MIIIDTHIQIWWVEESSRLTGAQRQAIENERRPSGIIGISAISVVEIARLSASGQIQLQPDALPWLRRLLSYPNVQLLPITPEIAVRAYALPEPFHPDPADRILVATALEHSCPLVASDGRILAYPHVNTIG